ncbi:MAG: adenine phosphoribosyltransferase [Prevotella sp.]|nr:adenine phosphoribosyltransferase [Prevotella sp.]MBR4572076.1 adenine phosphoribosyltransferase [Prevotella sp.]MBR4650575.1 adenine phosphoribosyltransferase [Prevotella sp.]
MNNKKLLETLRAIPDFPKPGINFQDITPLFNDKECLRIMHDEIIDMYKDKGITKVVGIESRGFLLATTIALELGAGVAICRKKGKLPGKVVEEHYEKEYGKDTVCLTEDAITSDDVVLIHDDLLATGGSLLAAYNLVKKFNPKEIHVNVIIELLGRGLEGRKVLEPVTDVTTLLKVQG